MITKAKQPNESEKPTPSVGDVLAKKKIKNNSFLHCPKCNRAYKLKDKLATHIETCKGKSTAGRKPGVVSEQKLILNEAKKKLQERIAKHADQLFNAQFNLAIGQTMLFVKVTERDSKGKPLCSYIERVENPETIKEYLDDENALNDDEHFYYITTRPANNQALANLLDRAFGKPKENVELSEDPDAPVGTHGTGSTTALREAFVELVKSQIKKGGKSK